MGARKERLVKGKIYRWYDTDTGETLRIDAPIWYKEDFLVPNLATPSADTYMTITETGTSVDVACQTDAAGANGVLALILTDNDEDQLVAISGGDDHRIDLGGTTTSKYVGFEAKIKYALDGSATDGFNGLQIFVGLMGDLPTLSGTGEWIDATEYVGFIIGATPEDDTNDLSIYCATDDTGTATLTDSGTDLVDDTWIILRFDVIDKTQVAFYINNQLVQTAALADHTLATLVAGTEAVMQPVIGIIKHTTEADNFYGVLSVDYYQHWGVR